MSHKHAYKCTFPNGVTAEMTLEVREEQRMIVSHVDWTPTFKPEYLNMPEYKKWSAESIQHFSNASRRLILQISA